MPIPQYEDFELAIQRDGEAYRARVLHSPGGEATSNFALPFSPLEIENLLLRMGQVRARQRSGGSQKFDAARTFGSKLYDAVFADEVGKVWQKSLVLSDTQNKGLRIRLRLDDAPDLVDIPWELLYDPSLALFINATVQTPLVRSLNLPAPPRALTLKPPLKILVLISAPLDSEPLDAKQEWNNLQSSLQPLVDTKIIALERLEEANMPALQQRLRRNEYHVLHFIGHGDFDAASQQSSLLFEDEKQRPRPVSGQHLGTLLYDHKTLRFVYLNACEGAIAGASNPFNGVAQSLLRQGIPAVLAMQFLITDEAALKFSQEVIRALADNYPLDASLSEARKALYLSGNETEWATPVLYLRAPDGVLFDLQGTPPPVAIPPTGETQPSGMKPLGENGTRAIELGTANESYSQPPSANAFNPLGRWNIQVQDMVGSRLDVEFAANGTFQMTQQVGLYQVPVNGSWYFDPALAQLTLNGVINTFQPFHLALGITANLPNGYAAVGHDGIGYVLTRT